MINNDFLFSLSTEGDHALNWVGKIAAWVVLLLGFNLAHAQITLDITKGASGAGIPITIAPFGGTSEDIAGIIASDLKRTGKIAPQPPQSQADYAVTGQVRSGGRGAIVQFQLTGVQGGKLLDLSFDVPSEQLRPVAHRISDLIYEKLTGEKGLAGTRIAFVAGGGGTWFLVVADADGQNPRVILRSGQPIMSPAWSPDGRRLAVTLSKDGNPEIYAMDVAGGNPVRLTNGGAIDTEAVWLPDGSLVFTSDRGGSPQLYRIGSGGGGAQRLTFEGDYNARPAVSPDGRYIAMVHRRNGRFHIAVLDLQNRQFRVLTPGGLYESPSFAPNGKMVIYSNGQRLEAVSVDGGVKQDFALRGSVREPVWAPYGR
jgi:TolB protein